MSTIYSPAHEPKHHTRILVTTATACIVIVLAVAAVAGFAAGRHSIGHTTPSAPAHTVTPAIPAMPTPASMPSGATAAIKSYETQNGPGVGKWVIQSSEVSKVNPMYVFFRIGPAKGYEDSVQGGYGFALDSGTSWSVIGFGSAMVGCPGGSSQTVVVPSPVLAEFGFACPSN